MSLFQWKIQAIENVCSDIVNEKEHLTEQFYRAFTIYSH
jgi:hypothetical protein